ncbi:MAG: hypothetical protein LUF85_04265 [Bacteroides sp.]|nr:hypothetical protein [Bacteroides sp.]
MEHLKKVLQSAGLQGACSKSHKVSDYRSLVWLFFSPQGREFCIENSFPDPQQFASIAEGIEPYGVYVNRGEVIQENPEQFAAVGNTTARLTFDDPQRVHKVILMHGAKAHIQASNYAVILLVKTQDCDVKIQKDQTVVIL